MGRSEKTMTFIDKQKKKWIVDGYYLDGQTTWTILRSIDGQLKRVKGIL